MSDEEFKNMLVEHLIKNVGVNPSIAERDAESMIIGQKRIIDGEFAVLDMNKTLDENKVLDEQDKFVDLNMSCTIV